MAVAPVARSVHLTAWYRLRYAARLARSCNSCIFTGRLVNGIVYYWLLASFRTTKTSYRLANSRSTNSYLRVPIHKNDYQLGIRMYHEWTLDLTPAEVLH